MDNVEQIMSKDIIAVEAEESLLKAARLMKENNIGFLPVVKEEHLVGVITDRDIVVKGLAEKMGIEEKVSNIMTKECIAVESGVSLEEAMDIMAEHQVRRLCVIENEEIVGVCAIGDIARHHEWIKETGEALSNISIPTKRKRIRIN